MSVNIVHPDGSLEKIAGMGFGGGVPSGGTTGQVLTKKSNTDYDAEWKNGGSGDMLASVYDPNGTVAEAGGIEEYVDPNVTYELPLYKFDYDYAFYAQNGKITGTNKVGYSAKRYDVRDVDTIYATFSTDTRSTLFSFVIFIDDNLNVIEEKCRVQTATDYVREKLVVPEGATYCSVTYYSAHNDCVVESHSLFNPIDGVYPISRSKFDGGYANIFRKIGIIGDSISCGAIDINGGQSAVDHWNDYAWANFMKRKTGCEVVKLAQGGLQVANWLDTHYSSDALVAKNKADSYFFMLGHNDQNHITGSVSDINVADLPSSDNTTTYGKYGRIVGVAKTANPDAKLFFITYPVIMSGTPVDGVNTMIREVCATVGGYLIDLAAYDKIIKKFHPTKNSPHYTPLGYYYLSVEIMTYIDYIVRHNFSEFADIEIVAGSSSTSSLSDLTDTDISNPEVGDVLVYDGEKWANAVFEGFERKKIYTPVEITLIEGKYIMRQNGNVATASNTCYFEVPVVEGERYRIITNHSSNIASYALYNSGGTFVSAYPTTNVILATSEAVDVTIPNGVVLMRCSGYDQNGTIFRLYKVTDSNEFESKPIHDILYGKKWAVCGDSFTYGSLTGYTDSQGHTQQSSDGFDPIQGKWKNYSYHIANRTGIKANVLAYGGNDFTNVSGAIRPFSVSTSNVNYTQIPTDADYVTIAFGLNESDLTAEQIGTKTDTTNETLWGAYYVVLNSILTSNPMAKIGIIISDAWITQTYHDALIEIAKYWGVPYLDLRDGVQVPMMLNGRLSDCSAVAKNLRDGAMEISSNDHPNPKGYEYRSTVIENFLRSL